jgi:hypothetical protein
MAAAASVAPGTAIPGLEPWPAADPAAVNRLVQQAAYFSLFSLPSPTSQSTGVPLAPGIPLPIAFEVHEGLHRFEVKESLPTAECGLRIEQAKGSRQVAKVDMQMTPMPSNYQPGPGRVPPPTILLPFLSQRFTPLQGSFHFLDAEQSGFTAIGAGRTLPADVFGVSQTRLAAVIDVLNPTGRLAGLPGTGIIIGDIEPPSGFHFNVLFRIVDPGATLQATAPTPPLEDPQDPTPPTGDPNPAAPPTSFMPFLAEADPDRPLQLAFSADGRWALIEIHERLRLVHLAFAVGPPGLRSRTVPGALVGRHRMRLIVDLSHPGSVLPGFSEGSEFAFFDARGTSIGGFKADLMEARLMPTTAAGGEASMLRLGGFAPPTIGSGQFRNPVGMVSVNGAFSVATGAVSTLYMVRLSDPLGVFRPVVL